MITNFKTFRLSFSTVQQRQDIYKPRLSKWTSVWRNSCQYKVNFAFWRMMSHSWRRDAAVNWYHWGIRTFSRYPRFGVNKHFVSGAPRTRRRQANNEHWHSLAKHKKSVKDFHSKDSWHLKHWVTQKWCPMSIIRTSHLSGWAFPHIRQIPIFENTVRFMKLTPIKRLTARPAEKSKNQCNCSYRCCLGLTLLSVTDTFSLSVIFFESWTKQQTYRTLYLNFTLLEKLYLFSFI